MPAPAVDTSGTRLHVVANRLPVTWSQTAGWTRAPGGLVTALASYTRHHRVTWFGSSASLGDTSTSPPSWPHGPLSQVPIESKLADGAVNGMSNSCLWPSLHGIVERVRWHDEWWEAYRIHNQRFARVVADGAGYGDVIWIHDYQLLLVAAFLASARPDLVIGLSIHTPVDASALAELPAAAELIEALQAPRLIGVQTANDREALTSFSSRSDATVVSPVSIDPIELIERSHERATGALVERMRARLGTRLSIVGVDRIDYTKGLLQRIDAIDRAFRHGLIRPDDVDIVQIAQPSRPGLAAYRNLRLQVERRAHDVASHWLRSDGTPAMRWYTDGVDRRHVAALLSAADVALVTPVRDGMNLVAKEYSILNEARSGVLVLSEGAGAVAELGAASVIVDGSDAASIAEGLARALELDAPTRRSAARRRADAVRAWTSEHWATDFEGRLRGQSVSLL